ncbi:MAG TPA: KH domain-containing protein [Pyrinomonadaceae bacterium]
MPQITMRDTIEVVVKALVDDSDAVDVREIDRNGTTRIEVRVAPPDMGKVIGKQGRTVRALRSLVYAAGLKQNRRYVLDVVE